MSDLFKRKEIEREDKVKISEVGYYTLAFSLKNDDYSEEYTGDKIVVEINSEEDYQFSPHIEDKRYYHFFIKFLTSKKEPTNISKYYLFKMLLYGCLTLPEK